VTILWTSVASLLGAFIVLETGARWWIRFRRAYYVLPPGLRLRLHIDRETFPELEPVVRFEVNADGERGPEVPRVARGERLYRVLVAGGSQPEGAFLDQPSAWPAMVERLIATPEHLRSLGASKAQVGNTGRSGVGSAELDLIFERVLPRYPRLQLIVVLVGVSDVMHWMERGCPRLFPPVRAADVFTCHPEGPFGWRPRAWAAMELLRRARHRWLRPVEVHWRAGAWIGRACAMRARASEIRTTLPNPAPMLDHFEFHLEGLLRRARAHADRVLVVRQPWFNKEFSPEETARMWHGAVGEPWRTEVSTYYSLEIFKKLMSLLDVRAAAVCDALGVEHLDLMPILDQSLASFHDGFHLTPAGAEAVASAVSEAILRTRWRQVRQAGAEIRAAS
jgi:lysophospholipase L1-like esterase